MKELVKETNFVYNPVDYDREDPILHQQIEYTLCMGGEVNQQDAFTELVRLSYPGDPVRLQYFLHSGGSFFLRARTSGQCDIDLSSRVEVY